MAIIQGNAKGGAAGGGAFYPKTIDQSLRFNDNDSAFLSKTPASSSAGTNWTWSGWVKLGSSLGTRRTLFSAKDSASLNGLTGLFVDENDRLDFVVYTTSAEDGRIISSAKLRDPSAWYHVVIVYDSTNGTANDRMIAYINGERVTALDTNNTASSSHVSNFGRAFEHAIGRYVYTGSLHFDGYLSEVHFVDGQALDATSFGEFKNGVWVPKDVDVTYGTNGFYLDFADGGALGDDESGNANDWTANNLASTDQVLDSPTNNFCTWNPLYNFTGGGLLEGNLRVGTSAASYGFTSSTIAPATGKWYVELLCNSSTTSDKVGIAKTTAVMDGTTAVGFVRYNRDGGYIQVDGTTLATGATFGANDIVGIASDLDSETVTFYKNGVSQGTVSFTAEGDYFIGVMSDGRNSLLSNWSVNFGQDSSFAGNKTPQGNTDANGIGDFYYAPPAGALALCTSNLPEPAIGPNSDTTSDEHFNTVLWTGNSSTQTITTGFDTDFVWLKSRNQTYNHNLFDIIRGPNYYLSTNYTNAEGYLSNLVTSFTDTGYTLGSHLGVNQNGTTYVGWNWKANGSGVSNTDGSITSTVSANTDAGFSIVSWVSTSTITETVGHGLNAAPEVVIWKARSTSSNWFYITDTVDGSWDYLVLNSTAAKTDYPDGSTTSTTIKNFYTNPSQDLIAYCFHSVDGFSKFGSYTGNGSADGPMVFCGFRPSFVLTKETSGAGDWALWDTARESSNVMDANLKPNSSEAESSTSVHNLDMLSNGFKLRTTNLARNENGASYIFMAFAENPFKYSNAR